MDVPCPVCHWDSYDCLDRYDENGWDVYVCLCDGCEFEFDLLEKGRRWFTRDHFVPQDILSSGIYREE